MGTNTEKFVEVEKLYRVRDFEALNPKWNVFIKPLSACSGNYVEEEAERLEEQVGVEDTEEAVPYRHKKTSTQVASQTIWQHA